MIVRLRHETHIINGLMFFAPCCFRGDHIPDVHFDAFQPTYLLDLQGVVTNSLHALANLKHREKNTELRVSLQHPQRVYLELFGEVHVYQSFMG